MSDFERTFSQLRRERINATNWLIVGAVVLLIAWLSWGALARLSLYEVSSDARIELDAATFPIDSPFVGKIVESNLRVGITVHRGDLLVELDSMPQQLELREEQVKMQGLGPQLSLLHAQIDAEGGMRGEESQSTRLGAEEVQNRVRASEISARQAERDLARTRTLYAQKMVSTHDLEVIEGDAARLRATVAELTVQANRIPQEQRARDREREGRVARLNGEIANVETYRDSLQAEIGRLTYEIERCRVRAPADGRVAEAAILKVGAVVAEREHLGSIMPPGQLRIVALYPAQSAFGRIRAGQAATLRLDGFPWAEFGAVPAIVEHVAQEVRDGKVSVELSLVAPSDFRGSLQHGMPGTLEIAIEQVSPLGLILRTAGQWLTRPI